jgi:hypothetical protein
MFDKIIVGAGIAAAVVLLGLFLYCATEAEGDNNPNGDPLLTAMIGDTTCDLDVTATDALLILRHIGGFLPVGHECPDIGTAIPTLEQVPDCYEDEYIYFNDFPVLEDGLKCVHIDWIFCDLLQSKWDANQNELELMQDGILWLWENDSCYTELNE